MHVPGWHKATQSLQDDGKIQMVGIIQEQHPDRARLFMQWKQMGWPILVDSYDLLEAPYVPITLAIDEQGVIRRILPSSLNLGELGDEFLEETFAADAADASSPTPPAAVDATASAATVAVWSGSDRLDSVIEAFQEAVRREPDDGMAHFRLGVAYRMRYDSKGRRAQDFQNAVSQWGAALEIDPNQYIWRRRIQQYGPRLNKPYPFYDWVPMARQEIRARGEGPATLAVEPRGSEFAKPIRTFAAAAGDAVAPDPMGRVLRDDGEFIAVETVSVPSAVSPGQASRIHVMLRPVLERKAHWNNEVEETVLWVDPPPGWEVDGRLFTSPLPESVVSQETRTLEVEVRAGEEVPGGSVVIPAYALYYVCEDINGVCIYRRQDLHLEVAVKR